MTRRNYRRAWADAQRKADRNIARGKRQMSQAEVDAVADLLTPLNKELDDRRARIIKKIKLALDILEEVKAECGHPIFDEDIDIDDR